MVIVLFLICFSLTCLVSMRLSQIQSQSSPVSKSPLNQKFCQDHLFDQCPLTCSGLECFFQVTLFCLPCLYLSLEKLASHVC